MRPASMRSRESGPGAGQRGEGAPPLALMDDGAHDLRHTYGSHLVRQGLDVVRISRQLGHARPSITLDVYAHELEQT